MIMREYARITGLPEMPPLWSFGYQQSHRTLAGPDEIMWVAKTMREKNLPCDALIYLGTDFCPSGWNTHNGEFEWKKDVLPGSEEGDRRSACPALQGRAPRRDRRHAPDRARSTIPARSPSAAGAFPTRTATSRKGTWPDERSVGCYWPHHKGVFDLGIDGWWPDQGDGLDRAVAAESHPHVLGRLADVASRERPYALHRNGYAGMARYGAFLWSGDVYSTWETLKTHVPVAVNTALSGIPYWGTDIGGFVPTPEFLGELYLRWFQFMRVLSAVPRARTHVAPAPAVGLEHWRSRSRRDVRPIQGAGRPPDSELCTTPQSSRSAGSISSFATACCPTSTRPSANVRRPACRSCARSGCTTRTTRRRRTRRSVSLGTRHPGRAGGGEGRDLPPRLYLPRAPGSTSGPKRGWTAAARSTAPSISRRCRCSCAPGRSCQWARSSNTVDEVVDGPLTVTVYPGARRSLRPASKTTGGRLTTGPAAGWA